MKSAKPKGKKKERTQKKIWKFGKGHGWKNGVKFKEVENSHLKALLNSIPDRLQDIAWEFSTEKREDDYGREEDDYGYNHDDGDISCSSSSSCESWVEEVMEAEQKKSYYKRDLYLKSIKNEDDYWSKNWDTLSDGFLTIKYGEEPTAAALPYRCRHCLMQYRSEEALQNDHLQVGRKLHHFERWSNAFGWATHQCSQPLVICDCEESNNKTLISLSVYGKRETLVSSCDIHFLPFILQEKFISGSPAFKGIIYIFEIRFVLSPGANIYIVYWSFTPLCQSEQDWRTMDLLVGYLKAGGKMRILLLEGPF